MSNFETWWEREGQEFLFALNTTTDDDIKLVAEFAWKNGAYCAEQAEQEPVACIVRDCCEAEKADPDHSDTICIAVDDLTEIVTHHTTAPVQQAEQEQEPVAWMWACTECGTEAEDGTDCRICSSCGYHKFYKAPKVATCVCAAKTQEKVKQEPVTTDLMDMLRLIETIKYLRGIAERGLGREIRDDETIEQFVLGYVKQLEAAPVKPVKQEPFMCEPVPPISEDGWTDWVCPKPQGYLMQCCDCGLIHEVDSRVAMYQPMPSEEFEVVENPNMQCQWRVRRRDDLRESNVKV